MGRQLSMATRQELEGAIGARYTAGSREEKRRILDEFVAVSGYHRKSAIRLLAGAPVAQVAAPRGRPRRYDAAVREALACVRHPLHPVRAVAHHRPVDRLAQHPRGT